MPLTVHLPALQVDWETLLTVNLPTLLFVVIGVPLVKGRFFEPHDTVDAPGVVIVNESLARREWPNEDPIGQRITTAVRYIGQADHYTFAPRPRVRKAQHA